MDRHPNRHPNIGAVEIGIGLSGLVDYDHIETIVGFANYSDLYNNYRRNEFDRAQSPCLCQGLFPVVSRSSSDKYLRENPVPARLRVQLTGS